MADLGAELGGTDTTIDFIAIAVIAIAVGFIAYEGVQGLNALSNLPSWIPYVAGAGVLLVGLVILL